MSASVVQLRRLNSPVTYAESRVFYDAWGTPYAKANLYGHARGGTPYSLVLNPDGTVQDSPWRTEWRLKSGPEVTFPENLAQRQSRGWTPEDVPQ